jgi:hypothetical protein
VPPSALDAFFAENLQFTRRGLIFRPICPPSAAFLQESRISRAEG